MLCAAELMHIFVKMLCQESTESIFQVGELKICQKKCSVLIIFKSISSLLLHSSKAYNLCPVSVVMKSHTSHDVLLLCPSCHQRSNMSDLAVRHKLSKMCDAPLSNEEGGKKAKEVPQLR